MSAPGGARPSLYLPPKAALAQAEDAWGANCGPGVLAALSGESLDRVHQALGGDEWPGYTNAGHMRQAMEHLGYCCRARRKYYRHLVERAAVLLTEDSPAARDGRGRHWIGLHRGLVYDFNTTAWMIWSRWYQKIGRELSGGHGWRLGMAYCMEDAS